jgi:hypothetical protein
MKKTNTTTNNATINSKYFVFRNDPTYGSYNEELVFEGTEEECKDYVIKETKDNTSEDYNYDYRIRKENKTMKKDYTLNGTINATTWQEFRKAMKEAGIETGTKSYEQLVEEYNKLNTPAPKFIITKDKGDYIVRNIVKASFIATKGESKGMRILTMHKLFGIIRKAYTNNLKDQLEEDFIKNVINELVKLKYITYKKYESGAMIFYPTTKAADYVANIKKKGGNK